MMLPTGCSLTYNVNDFCAGHANYSSFFSVFLIETDDAGVLDFSRRVELAE